jgi:hypothetical protein
LLWLIPIFTGTSLPEWLDLPGASLSQSLEFPHSQALFIAITNVPHSDPAVAQHIVEQVLLDYPPAIPAAFVWSRVMLLGLTLALIATATLVVRAQRRTGVF